MQFLSKIKNIYILVINYNSTFICMALIIFWRTLFEYVEVNAERG